MTTKPKPPPKRYCLPDPSQVLTDEIIMQQIEPGARIIDLGCGDGRLIHALRENHGCRVQGVEVDRETIVRAMERGVPVIQADLDAGLQEIPDQYLRLRRAEPNAATGSAAEGRFA